MALNAQAIAGDRNYIHLAYRFGIPEDVIHNLNGMMDVFRHLRARRITIGELLRTLRIMERHDVVNMVSAAVLEIFENRQNNNNSGNPGGNGDDDDDDDVDMDEMLTRPQQEEGTLVDKESLYPLPVQECMG